MSFVIWIGLHGAAAEEFETAEQAYRGYLGLQERGARDLQIVEDARDVSLAELAARVGASAEERTE
jgi:hypothetical protein